MSIGIVTHDLTGLGCPLHYIKAREIMQLTAVGEHVKFRVNVGESSDDVAGSLQQAGYQCEIRPQNKAHNIIEVVKHDDTQ
jgi:TusA-related sulfurtransferase